MHTNRNILATFFDMDGIIIDSEPLWIQARNEIISQLNVKLPYHSMLPDTTGLRVDQTICMWYHLLPKNKPSEKEIIESIIIRVMTLIEEKKPLLPGVKFALKLCKEYNFKIGLVSASPLFMLKKILELFDLNSYFDLIISAEYLPYSKPHPQIYLDAASKVKVDPKKCVAIEDSIHGMIATKAALMRSIVIPPIEFNNDPRWCLANIKLDNLTKLTFLHLNG
ncbi:2-deoxyglucose-6-phosphatase [Candidatus Pantoea edessiphila]|uniref:2-deoxyglucose-6-phosphatase n=1 Tax=Candidatus Pantoea edessiphila TaxID=2044610 RepID=A0A2P5T0K7_9GAMM|nr:hexitol phosphatase HxpB [Candidatus Pantoea edessiphila]PPI88128.1 2-deoxyglucose-6-phosphatase [Candidatus Pantoea edessiphila]